MPIDDKVQEALRRPDFGGASVTIPHKLSIMSVLNELSPAAKLIGAVNTVIPVRGSDGVTILRGGNTDWVGIRNCIQYKLAGKRLSNETGLIVGAGGTSRAASML